MDILLIGRVAEAGTLELVEEQQVGLKEKYSTRYLTGGISSLRAEFADENCLQELTRLGCDTFIVGKQGICRSLWALGETLSCGLRVRLEDIPVSQFVIEIAEISDRNPYLMNSLGCIIACCKNGTAAADRLRELGYPAAVIGYTTNDNTRGLINHGVITYLTGK